MIVAVVCRIKKARLIKTADKQFGTRIKDARFLTVLYYAVPFRPRLIHQYVSRFRLWHRLPNHYRYYRLASRSELRDFIFNLAYYECAAIHGGMGRTYCAARKMILIFAHEQLRQNRRSGIALGQRQRHQIADDNPFATRQGVFAADIQFPGLVFQKFGNRLADALALGEDLVGFDDLVPTFRMIRKDTPLTLFGWSLDAWRRFLTGSRG